jgi:hypothetical protein
MQQGASEFRNGKNQNLSKKRYQNLVHPYTRLSITFIANSIDTLTILSTTTDSLVVQKDREIVKLTLELEKLKQVRLPNTQRRIIITIPDKS